MKIKRFSILATFVFLFIGVEARAAKVAQVIVPQASVYLYPQSSSNVIGRLNRGDSITVSNLPTEGFYKVRLPNGDLGWVSGNDILAGDTGGGGAGLQPSAPIRRRKALQTRASEDEGDAPRTPNSEGFRVQLSYGILLSSMDSGGLNTYYGPLSGLNLDKTFDVDLQFRINQRLFWVVRVETFSGSTGSIQPAVPTNTSQTTSFSEVPIELGLMWSPILKRSFRFSLGAFIGATASASTTISNNNNAQILNATYSSNELCGEIATQFDFALGDLFGFFLEGDYRYDKTGTEPASNYINVGTPAFTINYSGIVVRLGVELKI